tara:strand:+ start:271 stop:603 length:333 start_codon:yes stop_codon:yes gene_type:complete
MARKNTAAVDSSFVGKRYKTRPYVVDGKQVQIDGIPMVEDILFTSAQNTSRDKEEAAFATNQAATQYITDRVKGYPTIGDQLDALWKGGDDQAAMKVIVDKVKTDNPKPE